MYEYTDVFDEDTFVNEIPSPAIENELEEKGYFYDLPGMRFFNMNCIQET